MKSKIDEVFSIICVMVLLFGTMLFKSAWVIVIISITLLIIYGILKLAIKRGGE